MIINKNDTNSSIVDTDYIYKINFIFPTMQHDHYILWIFYKNSEKDVIDLGSDAMQFAKIKEEWEKYISNK